MNIDFVTDVDRTPALYQRDGFKIVGKSDNLYVRREKNNTFIYDRLSWEFILPGCFACAIPDFPCPYDDMECFTGQQITAKKTSLLVNYSRVDTNYFWIVSDATEDLYIDAVKPALHEARDIISFNKEVCSKIIEYYMEHVEL